LGKLGNDPENVSFWRLIRVVKKCRKEEYGTIPPVPLRASGGRRGRSKGKVGLDQGKFGKMELFVLSKGGRENSTREDLVSS